VPKPLVLVDLPVNDAPIISAGPSNLTLILAHLASQPEHCTSWLEVAVQDTVASAAMVRAQCEQHRLALQALCNQSPPAEVPIATDDNIAPSDDVAPGDYIAPGDDIVHVLSGMTSPDGSSLDILAALSDLPAIPDSPIFEPDPLSWAEACSSPHADEWRCSFQEELDSLKNMNVYALVPGPLCPLVVAFTLASQCSM
jgi:hypothetical protein